MMYSTEAALQAAAYDRDQSGDSADLFDRIRYGALGGGASRAGSYPTGLRALMLAVLEDGVRCFLSRDRQVHAEAELWMTTQRQNWPFCFTAVCHTLGLNPDAVHAAARRLREREASPRRVFGRTRPNVRRRGRITLRRSQAARLR
jgi:hypothetical protein